MSPTRDALLDAAVDQIDAAGLEGLTLRSIARRCGVSHAAPARHFDGVGALLSAVAARSFRSLTATLDRHVDDAGDDVFDRLRGAANGYVQFATTNPGEYELMFRPERLDPTDTDLLEAGRESFGRFEMLIGDAQLTGWQADVDRSLLAGVAWASTHGVVSLWIQGALTGAIGVDDHRPVVDTLINDVLRIGATASSSS
ncbi:MAG: TetR/AcrR family transcriptional regulator [Actinomycetota bacterium]